MRIGSNLDTAAFGGLSFTRGNPRLRGAAQAAADDPELGFGRDQAETPQVGFGQGTVSAPAAVLRTVGRNMQEARQLVPSLESLQEEARTRADAERQRIMDTVREREPRPSMTTTITQAQTQAAGQARRFINALNDQAGVSMARTRGEEDPTPRGADMRVGDEIVPLHRTAKFDFRV